MNILTANLDWSIEVYTHASWSTMLLCRMHSCILKSQSVNESLILFAGIKHQQCYKNGSAFCWGLAFDEPKETSCYFYYLGHSNNWVTFALVRVFCLLRWYDSKLLTWLTLDGEKIPQIFLFPFTNFFISCNKIVGLCATKSFIVLFLANIGATKFLID